MEKMEQKEQVTPFRHEVLNKSNYFIGMKYKASVLEHQITYLAMLKVQQKDYVERPDGIYVTLSAAEIREATGNTSGSFYAKLKNVADEMTGNNFGKADDENEHFIFITLINRAEYDRGRFDMRFPLELKKYLINVSCDFTQVSKKIAMALKKKPYSFPLYQVLKKQCYYPKGYNGEKNYVFSVVIGLAELKLEMGLVNLKDSPDVRKALREGTGTQEDYERAVKKSKDKMYDVFGDFESRCLKPSVQEINEKSDIFVKYKKNKQGRGGRVYSIDFTIYLTDKTNKNLEEMETFVPTRVEKPGKVQPDISQEDIFRFCMEACSLLSEYSIGLPDMMSIAEAANYDIEKIKKAKNILQSTTGEINNLTGWLISCIKEGYEEPIQRKATGKKNSFNNFKPRDYSADDIKELEKALLN